MQFQTIRTRAIASPLGYHRWQQALGTARPRTSYRPAASDKIRKWADTYRSARRRKCYKRAETWQRIASGAPNGFAPFPHTCSGLDAR